MRRPLKANREQNVNCVKKIDITRWLRYAFNRNETQIRDVLRHSLPTTSKKHRAIQMVRYSKHYVTAHGTYRIELG